MRMLLVLLLALGFASFTPAAEPPAVPGALPPFALLRFGQLPLRHVDAVCAVAVAPSGALLASAGTDQTICLWPRDGGRVLRQLKGHTEEIRGLVFTPDGKTLCSAGLDHTVRLWDLAKGEQIAELKGHEDGVEALALSPDGKTLASGGRDHVIRLWDLATQQETALLRNHTNGIAALAFAPDGKTLASAGWDHTVRFWDVVGRRQKFERNEEHTEAVEALAWSPDGERLASAGKEGVIQLWEAKTAKPLRKLGGEQGRLFALLFSPDGKSILAGGDGVADGVEMRRRTLVAWDVETGKSVREYPGHGGRSILGKTSGSSDFTTPARAVTALAAEPDGKVFVSAGVDGTLRRWDLASGKTLTNAAGHQDAVTQVAVTPDGRQVITAGLDGTVRVWDAKTGDEERQFLASKGGVLALALSPDGQTLATGGHDQQVRLWDLKTAREQTALPRLQESVRGLAFAPDGKSLAFGCDGSNAPTLRLWDLAANRDLALWPRPNAALLALAFAPDGKSLAAITGDEDVVRWELPGGKALPRLRDGSHGRCLAYSPDGAFLAAGCTSADPVLIWDLAKGSRLQGFDHPAKAVRAIGFSPDGATLATGSDDGLIRLWERTTGLERRVLSGHQGHLTSLAFTPDGAHLVSGSSDQTALLWDVFASEKAKPDRPGDGDIKGWWDELASKDTATAFEAFCQLRQASAPTLAFLGKNLHPIPAVTKERLAKLIADLDANLFDDREKATDALAQLGKLAEPALRKTLADDPSAEVKRRIEDLLQKLGTPGLPPDWLRLLRCVELLESLHTAEARTLLEALAAGGEAPPTEAAKAAVGRVKRRK
jgi:WD40 repeat protein